jgi:hypothetical protein
MTPVVFCQRVASHFANMLKVSRVEGTRFHVGGACSGCWHSVPQRNELLWSYPPWSWTPRR